MKVKSAFLDAAAYIREGSLYNLHQRCQATQQAWQKTQPIQSDSKRMIPVFNPNPHRFIGAFPCSSCFFLFFLLPILLFTLTQEHIKVLQGSAAIY